MKKQIDLLEGNLWRDIALFSLPLVFTNLLQVLFNMADIAVVGRFAGSSALGSVGSDAILISLFTGLLIGIGSGVNVLSARYIGERNYDRERRLVCTAFFFCLCAGIVIAVIGNLGAEVILTLMHTKDELMHGAVLYLRVYLMGMPALALYNWGNAVFSSDGDTKKPLLFLSISGVLNVLLNLFFVIVLKLSVLGVALASALSQYAAAGMTIYALLKSDRVYGLHLRRDHLDLKIAKRIAALGIPAGLQNAIFMFANLFIQAGVNSFSVVMVEGNAAATNADSLVYDVMAAIYVACSSFMSQNYGAGQKERVQKSYFITLLYSWLAGAVLGISLILMGRSFLGLFTSEAAVVDAGMSRLKIMGLSYAFSAFMDNTIAASRGLGKTVVPTFIVIMGSCVFRIIWIMTVFAHFHTIPSLYLLYIFSWGITASFEYLYYRRVYREAMALLDA